MNASETVQPSHRRRLAIVYVRQSSPNQPFMNKESLKLQYNLQHHASAAGWDATLVRVIDTDLGRTARTAQGRQGFQELVTLVNQEQVGIIFAYDVTRLARNCTDWYQLLDLCGFRSCLVGDQDGIYDPATPNGRLILGLKGLISELALHTLKARQQQKAFLRCLIDKVVVHRCAPDTLKVRMIWRGGDTTTTTLPVTVGALARLSGAAAMEKEILRLAKKGETDEDIAKRLTEQGYRSPKESRVLPSTVQIIGLRHRLFRKSSQSHPRHIPGFLTLPQVAAKLGITPHWLYDRIDNGTIEVARDADTNLYLFPDNPRTITLFKQLWAGKLQKLRFSEGYQHA